MCGEIGEFGGDYEDGGRTFAPTTQRARREYACAACGGGIAAGGYYARYSFVEDGRADSLRMHIQCRDFCREYGLIGFDVLSEEALNNEELGEGWLDHRRALYEWATGGAYQRDAGGER
jgi:hypothetical protein